MASRLSRRRPPRSFLAPWHERQCSTSSGRTLASKKSRSVLAKTGTFSVWATINGKESASNKACTKTPRRDPQDSEYLIQGLVVYHPQDSENLIQGLVLIRQNRAAVGMMTPTYQGSFHHAR